MKGRENLQNFWGRKTPFVRYGGMNPGDGEGL